MIENYKNLGGNSAIIQYEILDDKIRVQFKGGKWYTYSYAKAGNHKVDEMKKLARNGIGLCSYIQYNVKYDYD